MRTFEVTLETSSGSIIRHVIHDTSIKALQVALRMMPSAPAPLRITCKPMPQRLCRGAL